MSAVGATSRHNFITINGLEQNPEAPPPQPNPLGRNLASNFTSSGCESLLGWHSLGAILTLGPKLIYNKVARWGEEIQDGHDRQTTESFDSKFWVGATLKGLASICGGVTEVVEGAIDTSVALIKNLAESTLRLLAAGALYSFAALNALSDPLGFEHGNQSYNDTNQLAKDIVTPGLIKKAEQTPLPKHEAKRANFLLNYLISKSYPNKFPKKEALEKYTSFKEKYSDIDHPAFSDYNIGWRSDKGSDIIYYFYSSINDIPDSVLARRKAQTNTGEVLALDIDTNNWTSTVLIGDEWSALHVGVFKEPNGKIILAFPGTYNVNRWKTNVGAALGIYDSAFQDANKLVKAFADLHGAENIEVIGFSAGGALAQFAGINNGVKVTAFNAMGLHVTQRNKLGKKMANADVTLINTEQDELSQWGEHLLASSQVGRRYLIPNSHGHNDIWNDLQEYAYPKVPV